MGMSLVVRGMATLFTRNRCLGIGFTVGAVFLAVLFIMGLWLADRYNPLHLPEEQSSYSTVVLDSKGYPLRAFADDEGVWRYRVTLDQVSPRYLDALLAYEDRFFYQHPGVNPFSLVRAAWQWLRHGEIVSGGSTLTMQVARILYPHSKTVWGKLYQMLRAFQLEWHLSKKTILELYLNHAPFGGTLEGVQAASFQYFQKPASELRRSEAALLAVLPQAPSRLRPDRYPQRTRAARDKVLDRLLSFRTWGLEAVRHAREEPVAVWDLDQPMVAPILARRLVEANPGKRVIHTTIDRNIQGPVEEYVRQYARMQGAGVSAAVMVVENATHKVRAYVASSDFLDASRAGQVDMVQAIRSPGSTLKPLLYGLAIDDHLIHSHSLMADVPRVARDYRPGNFSRGFSGAVSISEALIRSLNIPFVQLIEAYGEQRFVNRLDHVQQPLQVPGGLASAAVILGGGGSSLERLVNLYSAMANDGLVYSALFMGSDQPMPPRRLLSKEAAWITYDTLRKVRLPEGETPGISEELLPKVAWKSGTSYGHRDVWAVGLTKDYTVGVWLGRPDGQPMRKKMGAQVAGPLLFTVFNRIDPHSRVIEPPAGVVRKNICWPDGRAQESITQGCDEQYVAWTKQGVTPRTLRPESGRTFFNPERRFMVNARSGFRANRHCHMGTLVSKEVFLWPLALESWLPREYRRSSRVPVYDDRCRVRPVEMAPLRILGAEDGQVFYRIKNQKVPVDLRVEGASGKVSWYLNGAQLPGGSSHIRLDHLVPGSNQLLVMDERGAVSRLTLVGM